MQVVNPGSHDDWELPSELQPLAAKLAALQPRSDRLNRERLVFLAGRASADDERPQPEPSRRPMAARWAWPASFAAMTAVAATLLFLLIFSPGSERGDSLLRTANEKSIARNEPVWAPIGLPAVQTANLDAGDRLLSAADAHRVDVFLLTSANDKQRLAADKPAESHATIREQHPIITPASWESFIGESQRVDSPVTDPLNRSLNHGASS